jgi:hypothetical protein
MRLRRRTLCNAAAIFMSAAVSEPGRDGVFAPPVRTGRGPHHRGMPGRHVLMSVSAAGFAADPVLLAAPIPSGGAVRGSSGCKGR